MYNRACFIQLRSKGMPNTMKAYLFSHTSFVFRRSKYALNVPLLFFFQNRVLGMATSDYLRVKRRSLMRASLPFASRR